MTKEEMKKVFDDIPKDRTDTINGLCGIIEGQREEIEELKQTLIDIKLPFSYRVVLPKYKEQNKDLKIQSDEIIRLNTELKRVTKLKNTLMSDNFKLIEALESAKEDARFLVEEIDTLTAEAKENEERIKELEEVKSEIELLKP